MYKAVLNVEVNCKVRTCTLYHYYYISYVYSRYDNSVNTACELLWYKFETVAFNTSLNYIVLYIS